MKDEPPFIQVSELSCQVPPHLPVGLAVSWLQDRRKQDGNGEPLCSLFHSAAGRLLASERGHGSNHLATSIQS